MKLKQEDIGTNNEKQIRMNTTVRASERQMGLSIK